jgi:hypothetical protein
MASRAAVSFKSGLSFSPEAQKLFSKREWQRAMKAALIDAGRDWIAGALPKRFTSFAITDLGYTSKKISKKLTREEQIRLAIALMRTNGQYDRIVQQCCAPWGGWDPTGKAAPSGEVWRRWSSEALKSGRIKVSNSGDWKTARQKMRKEVIERSRLRERVRNFAIDEYLDGPGVEPIPLVETGDLEKYAKANARPDAKTKGGTSELAIRIPRIHPLQAKDGAVLGRSTPTEADHVSEVFTSQMEAFVAGSSVRGSSRKRLVASKQQKRDIERKINSAKTRGALARAHKNRRLQTLPQRG